MKRQTQELDQYRMSLYDFRNRLIRIIDEEFTKMIREAEDSQIRGLRQKRGRLVGRVDDANGGLKFSDPGAKEPSEVEAAPEQTGLHKKGGGKERA